MGAALPTPRSGLGGVTGANGRIYAIGGSSDSVQGIFVDTVEVYDPTSDQWTTGPSMTTARYALSVTLGADQLIYAVAGVDDNDLYLDSAEALDTTKGTWSPVAQLAHGARAVAGSATGADGRVYVVGGLSATGSPLDFVEVLTPGAAQWQSVASLPTPIGSAATAAAHDGRIYVFGGTNSPGAFVKTVQAYSPATGQWR